MPEPHSRSDSQSRSLGPTFWVVWADFDLLLQDCSGTRRRNQLQWLRQDQYVLVLGPVGWPEASLEHLTAIVTRLD